MADFVMETTEKIGVISINGKYSLELRKTKVNSKDEKYDLRHWFVDDNGHEKCNKGVRLTEDELLKLAEIIDGIGDFD